MDNNQYISAYIDGSVGVLHDFLSTILQLKAQLKVVETSLEVAQKAATENVVARDQVALLEARIEELSRALAQSDANLQSVTRDVEAQRQKASHVDAFANQITQLKSQITSGNDRITDLETKHASSVAEILKLDKTIQEKDKTIKSLEKELAKYAPAPVVPVKVKAPYKQRPITTTGKASGIVVNKKDDDF
jgi:chromosome segregation ATPase